MKLEYTLSLKSMQNTGELPSSHANPPIVCEPLALTARSINEQ